MGPSALRRPHPTRLSITFASALSACGRLALAEDILKSTIGKTAAGDDLKLHARLQLALLRTHFGASSDTEDVRRVAEEAISFFGSTGDDVGLASAWSAIGEVHHNAVQVRSRYAAYEQALLHAQRAGDRRLEREPVMAIIWGLEWGPIPVDEAMRQCSVLAGRYEGDLQIGASCDAAYAVLTSLRGEFEEARRLVARARQMWVELGDTVGLLRPYEALRLVEMHAGDAHAAEREVRLAIGELEQMGEKNWLSSRAGFLAEALVPQDRFEEAEHYVRLCRQTAAEDDVEAQALWRQVLARVLAARGEFDVAQRLAVEAVARAELTDALSWHGGLLLNQSHVLKAAGRTAEAAEVARKALGLFTHKGDLVGAERAQKVLAIIEARVPR